MTDSNILYEIKDLSKSFSTRGGSLVDRLLGRGPSLKAVDNVSFNIHEGEILGLAGQSGCGKSTLGELILLLQNPTSGEINFKGSDLTSYSTDQLKEYRQNVQVIFQDPYEAINPRYTVAQTVTEPLKIHGIGGPQERDEKAVQALSDAGLNPPEKYLDKLPNELSGGERQRVCIARALVLDPSVLIADEPVSMLDVSVRTELLQLFKELQRTQNLTVLYISHDLATINYLTDRTMIMYLGNLVEIGPTDSVIHESAHPYTEALLNSVPVTDPDKRGSEGTIKDDIPDPINLPNHCRFESRCEYSTNKCRTKEPSLDEYSNQADEDSDTAIHKAACYHPL
jgi:peptide/nickel transport system ATP-binding protein